MDISKAIAAIDKAEKSGALIFARRDEILDVSEQYEPLTTIISFIQQILLRWAVGIIIP